MNATYLDEDGKPQLLQMGCYGIGVTRIAGRRDRAEPRRARHHLARRDRAVHGGDLPDRLRPQRRGARRPPTSCTTSSLAAGIDVMLDDRGERPGAMFADWELIGVPHRVVMSDRGLKEGQLEYQGRRDAAADEASPPADVARLPEGQARRMTAIAPPRASARGVVAATSLGALAPLAAPRVRGRAGRGAARRRRAHRARGRGRRCARRRSPSFANIDERLAYLRWLGAMSERLQQAQDRAGTTRVEFLQTVWYESKRAGLEPALVLGLVQVESGFRKYAISERRRARLHAGDAVLDAPDRRRRRRPRCSTCRPTCASAA